MVSLIKKNIVPTILLLFWCVLVFTSESTGQSRHWNTLADGLDYARFKVKPSIIVSDSSLIVIRIDPRLWQLSLLAASGEVNGENLTAKEWCNKKNLVVAVNAGMYHTDFDTHCGYMKIGDHLNNPEIIQIDYRSAAGFNPIDDSLPAFKIFDLDQTDIHNVIKQYREVVQNIRLIKRPGENRWPEKKNRWSEAALGEDSSGRALFIFCRAPFSMHEFNEILLSLPIDLVCAQHLEGGPEAQLYLSYADTLISCLGSYETEFYESDENVQASQIPNVIGVRRR